jgi:hypothetical protein
MGQKGRERRQGFKPMLLKLERWLSRLDPLESVA